MRTRLAGFLTAGIGAAAIAAAVIALPAQGQEGKRALRVAIPKDYSNLSVYTAGSSDADPFMGLVYDTLFTTPYVDEPQPLLAESAKPDRANRIWTVKLRDGVVWHDGEPFDAEDVKFSYELYRDGPPNRWTHHASQSPDMEQIDVVDKRTLRIACAKPCPTLDRITLADLPIVAKHQWRGIGEPTRFDGVPLGTGPYRIVRRVPGERYELEANERYFAGRPVADRLILAIIPDPSASFLALRGGQVDAVARPLPPQLVDRFADDSRLWVLKATPFSDVELAFNMAREPFDQRAFRRAAMLAIDKDRLLQTVLLGRGVSGGVGWPHPDSPWTEEPGEMPHDPDEARRLLREAGLEGTEIEILIPQQSPGAQRATELAARDLGAVGIRARLRPVDDAARAELTDAGRFDAYVWPATAHALADPTQLLQSFKSSSYLGNYPNREVQDLLEQASAAPNVRRLRELLARTHGLIAGDPPVVPFFYPEERYAVRPAAFDGWRESPGLGVVHKFSLVAGAQDTSEPTPAGADGEGGVGPSALGIAIVVVVVLGTGTAIALRRRRSRAGG